MAGAQAAGDRGPVRVRQALRWALEDEGLAVAVAADAREALAPATPRPALVLLDLTLPDADGAAVARGLRARHGPGLAVLAITADGRAPEKAARTGAAWRELPAAYGAWLSIYRAYQRWAATGLWPRLLQALQEDETDR